MGKRHITPVAGGSLRLRLLDSSDLDKTLKWRNQEPIRRWFIHSEVIPPQQHRKWFEHYLSLDNDFVFIIEETEALKKRIGQISLYNIDWNLKRAEFGRLMIGEPDARGRGFAKEATRMILRYAFASMKLHSVELEVIRGNLPAIAIYVQMGFHAVREDNSLIRMVRYSDGFCPDRRKSQTSRDERNASFAEEPT